jgi:hypothetical protein
MKNKKMRKVSGGGINVEIEPGAKILGHLKVEEESKTSRKEISTEKVTTQKRKTELEFGGLDLS